MHAGISAVLAAVLLLAAVAVLAWRRRRRRSFTTGAPLPEPFGLTKAPPPEESLPEPPVADVHPRASSSDPRPISRPPPAEVLPPAELPPAAELPAPVEAIAAPSEPAPDEPPAAPRSEPEAAAPAGDGSASSPGDGSAPLVLVAKRGPTRYPVVLAHGFAGFDSLDIRGKRVDYFRGVGARLRASGVHVHVLRVSPLASIVARARELADQIQRLGCERVNIVAHSMGGLDARYAITCLGMAPRIASLTTIGTPHRGTPLADLGLLSGAFGRLPHRLGAIHDLNPRRMAAFNLAVDDAPGVAYGCIVITARGGMSRVHTLLVPGYLFLLRQAGDNDGVVPASSQRWGAVWGEIDADHWGAVGWSRAFDAGTFYERLAWDLGQRGF